MKLKTLALALFVCETGGQHGRSGALLALSLHANATDTLMAFWLGQKKDPRALAAIAEILRQ
jgi:hypothetical protein